MKNKIIAVIGIIALSLIIINMSASHSKLSKTVNSKNSIQLKTSKMQFDFDYTGGEQTFTAPYDGKYKLETWGAQGGNGSGGNECKSEAVNAGAYVSGVISLSKDKNLYIYVGGQGTTGIVSGIEPIGGYNGGSRSNKWANAYASNLWTGGGGGATHIATKSGLLSSLENNKDSVIIVASGGGGGDWYDWTENYSVGAGAKAGLATGQNGGGISGKGQIPSNNLEGSAEIITSRGTQTSGYAFGTAGTPHTYDSTGGSGGGYYGGISDTTHYIGASGSSYIGNKLLSEKHMACYNCETSNEVSTKTISVTCASETPTSDCSKIGNGYARITYLGN